MRLFRYISGNNQAEMKIEMTAPVAKKMNTGPRSMSYQTMSLFIPFKHQQDAPMPNNDEVNLEIVKPFCAYVKVYGGFPTLSKVRENYQSLLGELREDGRGDDISDNIYTLQVTMTDLSYSTAITKFGSSVKTTSPLKMPRFRIFQTPLQSQSLLNQQLIRNSPRKLQNSAMEMIVLCSTWRRIPQTSSCAAITSPTNGCPQV